MKTTKITVFSLMILISVFLWVNVSYAMFCIKCGARNVDEAVYCVKCGAKISAGADGRTDNCETINNSDKSILEKKLNGRNLADYIRENKEISDRGYEALKMRLKIVERGIEEKRINPSERTKMLNDMDKIIMEFIRAKLFMQKEVKKTPENITDKKDLSAVMQNKKDIQLIEGRIKINEDIINLLKDTYKKLADYNPPDRQKRRDEREDMYDFMNSVNFIRSFKH